MKKLNYILITLITLLLAASCSQDDVMTTNNNADEATISLFIELPDSGPLTRVYGGASEIDQLVYEVYQLDGEGKVAENASPALKGTEDADFNPEETLTLSLLKGKSYKIAVWAEKKGTNYYDTGDLRAVVVNYTGANNDDGQDAFFKTEEFTVTMDASLNVVLNRPFAQINVGVTNSDFDKAEAAGLVVAQSKVTIKDVPNTINLIDGSVSGSEDIVTYAMAPTPKEQNEGPLAVTINNEKKEYNYLSMSYLLVGQGKTLLTSGLTFEFANADNTDSVTLTQGLTNVPVQRNYRTNILGGLLTSDIDFSIIIDELFNDEEILVPVE